MRKTTRFAIGAWLLSACAGGDRAPENRADEAEGSVAAVIPDSPPTTPAAAGVAVSPAIGSSDTVVAGIVRETGSVPLTQLVVQDIGSGAQPVAVRGSFMDEIKNLIGAEIRVWGPPVDNRPPPPQRAVDVSGYEIVSIGGVAPIVGTLVEEDGAFFLLSGAKVGLGSIPEGFEAHVGAKIWVVGPQHDGALSVQSFGVIRN